MRTLIAFTYHKEDSVNSRDVVRQSGRIRRGLIALTFGIAGFAAVGVSAVPQTQSPATSESAAVSLTPVKTDSGTKSGGETQLRAGIRW